ncbi:L-threonine 3-dehydrogenase [Actinopolymorpha sp. B17G11]|uniref:L-threonine 3-dehydrogenase n=1 Tax=unclassified Actinopolymorpha TaxID=2627063 RepID=UPI0032D97550
MRALVKAKAEPGLWLEEIPDPAPAAGEVLIRILQTGICGTDLHIVSWDDWARAHVPVPLVIGHEFVGRIVELGAGVTELEVGDVVSGEGHLVCGRCRNCMAGRRHLCAHTQGVGLSRSGAFADYLTLPATNVWRHPADINLDAATIFDPFGNAVHTALTFPVLSEDVLITGAGPIGIMAAAVVRHAGARFVVITDVNDYRLELAGRVGVTRALNVGRTTLAEAQHELGMKEGFDIGLEMSGHPTALPAMVDAMAHGGRIAMLGIPAESDRISIDWSRVVLSMLTIKGIYGRQMMETWYAMSVLVSEGLDITPVITHRFPAADYEAAFATVREGQCGKVLLDWDQNPPEHAA